MHVIINKKELVDKVGKILPIATSSKINTLNSFILNITDSSFVYATDTEIAVKQLIKCENVLKEGSTCIPCKPFYDIIKECSDKHSIEIVEHENQIYIISGKTKVRLTKYLVEEYPVWKDDEYTYNTELNCDIIQKMIEKTEFAIGDSNVRYLINGLLIHVTPDTINFVGTDGHRLSICRTNISESLPIEDLKLIVPKKGVQIIEKLVSNCDKVKLYMANNFVKFQVPECELSIRLYEGNFPNYENVIPYSNDKIINVNTKEFTSMVRRVSSIAQRDISPLLIKVKPNLLEMECNSEFGEAKEDMPINYNNESIDIGFNATYLEEALSVIETENTMITFGEPHTAVYITETDNNQTVKYEHVIMPIRL